MQEEQIKKFVVDAASGAEDGGQEADFAGDSTCAAVILHLHPGGLIMASCNGVLMLSAFGVHRGSSSKKDLPKRPTVHA